MASSQVEVCENCKFSAGDSSGRTGDLVCRRYPPAADNGSRYRKIYASDWCGEWRSNKEPLYPNNKEQIVEQFT